MTAPTPEKIQRWTEHIDTDCTNMCRSSEGSWVNHLDHLRHLKLAQIEVLQSLVDEEWNSWQPINMKKSAIAKIAALRKEIEG